MMGDVDLLRLLKEKDVPSYFALRALNSLKGERVKEHRADIFRFLQVKYGEIPLERYVKRSYRLRELQTEFEQTGKYAATCYAEVLPIDHDDYHIALFLSFVLTNHRFEILASLEEWLLSPCAAATKLLSVGFGTGYELKVAHRLLPEWDYEAFDTSAQSFQYAS